jgi:hypothetical protein
MQYKIKLISSKYKKYQYLIDFMLDWYDQKNLVFLGLNDMDYNRNMWVICKGDVLQKIISS